MVTGQNALLRILGDLFPNEVTAGATKEWYWTAAD